MLKPAILYKDIITEKVMERYYTDDMFYITGNAGKHWMPEFNGDKHLKEFAIVDKDDNCIGFVSFFVDYYTAQAYHIVLISFEKSHLIGYAVKELIDMLFNKFSLHRIEWRMIGGNPVKPHYDKYIKKYNGNVLKLTDVTKDNRGMYHDIYIYEIISDKQ